MSRKRPEVFPVREKVYSIILRRFCQRIQFPLAPAKDLTWRPQQYKLRTPRHGQSFEGRHRSRDPHDVELSTYAIARQEDVLGPASHCLEGFEEARLDYAHLEEQWSQDKHWR